MHNYLKKDFLLGIGVGLILSAGLIYVSGYGQVSDQEIMKRAEMLGMVQKTESTGQVSPKTTQSSGNTAQPSQTAAQPLPDVQRDTSNESVAQSVAQEEAPNKTVNKEKTVTVTVTSGMGSEEIAAMLKKNGAIKDRDEFLQVVTRLKAHTRFQNGTFSIPVGTDMEKIVEMMTKNNN